MSGAVSIALKVDVADSGNTLAFYDTVVKGFVVKAQAEDQTWSEFSTLEVSAHMIETFVRFSAKRYSLILKT